MEHIEVSSEIESLLLESKLIKKYKPFYNIISKDDKSPYYIHITREKFPQPVINHEQKSSLAGPFLNRRIPQRILRTFRKITPFCTANRPVKRPCLYSQIGLCHPCPGEITVDIQTKQYLNNINLLKKMLKGKIPSVIQQLERNMNSASKHKQFETAAKLRDKYLAGKYLLETTISPDEYYTNPNLLSDIRQSALNALFSALSPYFPGLSGLNRIEAYDISHLRGEFASAALVVADKGDIKSSLFRHFNIKRSPTDNDVEMMRETITRRFHNSWPHPDLIVLDGGIPQLSAVLREPVIFPESVALTALSKKDETLHIFDGYKFVTLQLERTNPGLKLLQNLRDQAHRFSRRLHHIRRRSIIKA